MTMPFKQKQKMSREVCTCTLEGEWTASRGGLKRSDGSKVAGVKGKKSTAEREGPKGAAVLTICSIKERSYWGQREYASGGRGWGVIRRINHEGLRNFSTVTSSSGNRGESEGDSKKGLRRKASNEGASPRPEGLRRSGGKPRLG